MRIESAAGLESSKGGRLSRRALLAGGSCAAIGAVGYQLWTPGRDCDVSIAHRLNHGAWLTHAWWGDDEWYSDSRRRRTDYFGERAVAEVQRRMHSLGVLDWYVHAGPANALGELPAIVREQALRLVAANSSGHVLAWVGGVLNRHCFPADSVWRSRFAAACQRLVFDNQLAGIHLNIEPCRSFEPGLLELLDDLRKVLGPQRLSVAAYPPPTRLHPHEWVHWTQPFYREVSHRADDLAVMMYDTALSWRKVYTWLVREWTQQVLAWSRTPVRIGVPAYQDVVDYHDPDAENVDSALAGLSAALRDDVPANFAGWAVYAEWTLDATERGRLAACMGPTLGI